MKTNIKRQYYTKKLRALDEQTRKHNQWQMWKLLLAVTLGGVTAIIFPFALDVLEPTNNHFPQARVVKQEVKAERESYLIPRKSDRDEIERVAKIVCAEKGLGDYCWKDLVGITYAEHHDFNCSEKGDKGYSVGCYQIYRAIHTTITEEQAMDIDFATNWTLNRMIHYGYPVMRSYAIMKHNGTPGTDKTLKYLQTVNSYANSL